jgi:hypothetical protein
MRQIGRFQLNEAFLLHGLAEHGGKLRSKQEVASGVTPPHVEIAPSPTGFAVGLGAFDREGKRRCCGQYLDSPIGDFDLARARVAAVRSEPGAHDTRDRDARFP